MPKSEQRTKSLTDFVSYCNEHLKKGDEKGEAPLFLENFFRALGHPDGARGAGAILEDRIKKKSKGTKFADLVWKPIVLIEMKKRGTDLTRHYQQAFEYWLRLVPGRPRYVILCNFDEFWIYDFETQMDSPVDKVTLEELPLRCGPLAFLFPEQEEPVFGNHQESVTRAAADKLVTLFKSLIDRGIERDLSQRFVLQALLVLFAEDIGLLDQYFFARLLEECKKPADSYDLIGGLFEAMNTPGTPDGGHFKGVEYFNGGLFANPARIELVSDEIDLLREAARFDWSKVRPEIFGTIFEHSMGTENRHAYGAHFTSPVDIMKIVGATIVNPWRERIEAANTVKDLYSLLTRLSSYKILDPACGSGNFLYMAYRELKRLEARIYERLDTISKKSTLKQQKLNINVTTRNFYGMDINPFAVELAKVTMMLAHKLAIDELLVSERALPLDNLNANFSVCDALIKPDGSRTPWPKADAIIGNPPFLGAKRLKPERGVEYVKAVRRAYPEVPGMADYCVYWFRRTHDELADCTEGDPFTGRAGLVGTQNIRNNASREGGLDYICATGTVIEAVDNQPWSGEANVHVSVANWIKSQDDALIPTKKLLWSKVGQAIALPRRPRGIGPAHKEYELDCREVPRINSALSDQANVGTAAVLDCNRQPQCVFQGITPGHKGFVLSHNERASLIAEQNGVTTASIIHPYVVGDELLRGETIINRYLLDFEQGTMLEAQLFPPAFNYVKQRVLPTRIEAAEKGKDSDGNMRSHHKQFLEYWWQLSWGRAEMLACLEPLTRYLACSRVTKRPIFVFISSAVRPGDALQVFAFDDDYSFGILQSAAHWQWFVAKCSKLTERLRYTPESVFDTFPWPQKPTITQIDAVAAAGQKLRALRAETLKKMTGGLRALYRTLDLPGKNPLRDAHAALDASVLKAYGFSDKRDLLEQILELNQSVVGKIGTGETVTSPGVPTVYSDISKLVTEDSLFAESSTL